jgi:hypothetical protein
MMAQQSPIFVKVEAFLVWLLGHTRKFPKHERFRLAKRVEDAAFALHECLLYAARDQQAYPHLLQADVELDKLRTYLRLALEYQYTSRNQYGYAAQQVVEIGRLLGGWQKSIQA